MCPKIITPPFPDPNPSGLCMCGCGLPVAVVSYTRVSQGRYAGHHSRYIQSHVHRRNWIDDVIDIPENDHVLVPVNHQESTLYVLVDREDLPLISDRSWSVRPISRTFYAQSSMRYEAARSPHGLMHRIILGLSKDDPFVDHINGNGLDNRRSNLRLCTNSQNQANRHHLPVHTSSRFRGVFWEKKSCKWKAGIKANGKSTHLGFFDSEIGAALAYDAAAREAFGKFARLNFPFTDEEAA